MTTQPSRAPSDNARLPEAAQTFVLGGALLLSACVFSFRFTSFLHPKEALLVVALCVMAALSAFGRRSMLGGLKAFAPLWILLTVTVLIHGVFGAAQVPVYTLETAARYLIVLLLAAYAYGIALRSPEQGTRLVQALLLSAAAVALLGLLQYAGWIERLLPVFPGYSQRVYSVFGNQDLFGGYLAFAIPLLLGAYFRGRISGALTAPLLILLVPALLLSGSRTAWLAAAVGTAIVVPYSRENLRRVLQAGSLALFLAVATSLLAPDATLRRVSDSFSSTDVGFQARMWFWASGLRMAGDHPLIGVGPGNFQYWSPRYQGDVLWSKESADAYHNTLHTLHAHSDPLEVAAEMGLVGVLCLGWMAMRLRRTRGEEWGGLAALLCFGLFNTTLHSATHLTAAALLAAILLARHARSREESSGTVDETSSLAAYATLALALVLGAFTCWAVLIPSYRLSAARTVHSIDPDASESAYLRALDDPWPHYEAAEEWATVLVNGERLERALPYIETAAKGRDTGRLHYLAGRVAKGLGEKERAHEAFMAALWRWPGYAPAWRGALATAEPDQLPRLVEEARPWLTEAQWNRLKKTALAEQGPTR